MELIKMSRDEEGLAEELKIAVGAMEITDKTVKDVMTKIDVSFYFSLRTENSCHNRCFVLLYFLKF